jgi:HPt (histidine-containing phosphotransfer) domain-containing protein
METNESITRPQMTAQPIIDLALLRQQFGEDDALLREIIADYREQRIEISAKIHESLARSDLAAAAEHAHQIKGSLLTLGTQAAASAASELEAVARRGDAEGARAARERFEQELDTLAPELERLLHAIS